MSPFRQAATVPASSSPQPESPPVDRYSDGRSSSSGGLLDGGSSDHSYGPEPSRDYGGYGPDGGATGSGAYGPSVGYDDDDRRAQRDTSLSSLSSASDASSGLGEQGAKACF